MPADETTIDEAKRSARIAAMSARDRLDRSSRDGASDSAADRLLKLPEIAVAEVVMVYFALPGEIDPLPAARALRSRGVTIAYPRVESPGVLGVYAVEDERTLVQGPFGLSEPADAARILDPTLIAAVIVPVVAFDERGMRLGYGGGYYDRLLPRLRPDCPRIGLAFDEQLLAVVPAEAHDAAMDLVVTQTRVVRRSDLRVE
jgi:5-formyltetrahydrofolate cyclo-ligase